MPKGKGSRPSHRPSYFLGGGLWCLYWQGPAATSASAALDAGTAGDGVPRGVWLCLSLFLVRSFHRFRGRGGGGEAKLKFFFEKLTTSQLKDSYL